MSKRIEFKNTTKLVIAQRAGYRCSFPTCNKPTVGPGASPEEPLILGEAAHIYSAASNGPRGQGSLTIDALRAAQNGIWVCREHHKVIDPKNGGNCSPQIRLAYKHYHESKIARELGQLISPFGWVEKLQIIASPFAKTPVTINFGKATIFTGEHGSGKTTASLYLASVSSPEAMAHWLGHASLAARHEYTVIYRTPEQHRLDVSITNGEMKYHLDKVEVPFNPLPLGVVRLPEGALQGMQPLLNDVSRVFGVTTALMKQALVGLPIKRPGLIESIRVNDDDSIEVSKDDQKFISLGYLSGGEKKMFLLECAIALAQFSASYRATVLILDDGLHGLDGQHRTEYLSRLNAPGLIFQTILIDVGGREDIPWGGWQYVSF
jgi:hypothetical protein